MKIIAIEGLDKSGKHSQALMLTGRLQFEGYKVVKSEHHRYDQPTGKLVMDWLTKKWFVDQNTIELIMTADKQAQQRWYWQLEIEGYDFLVLDRYTLSQIAYSLANRVDLGWTIGLQQKLRKPDMEIVIDIPVEVSMTRKGKHNDGVNDKYESDLMMLETVRSNYILPPNNIYKCERYIIDGVREVEEIHEDIYQIVKDTYL